MRQPIDIWTDPNHMLRGIRYHDGRVQHVAFEGDDATVRILSVDGEPVDLVLSGVKAWRQTGLTSESIVGWIFLVDPAKAEPTVLATMLGSDGAIQEGLEPGELIVVVEAIMGIEIVAVCRGVVAYGD